MLKNLLNYPAENFTLATAAQPSRQSYFKIQLEPKYIMHGHTRHTYKAVD